MITDAIGRAVSFIVAAGQAHELMQRVARPDGKVVLVALGLEPDAAGAYRVKSSYLLSAEDVDNRRQAGRLKAVLPP